MAMGRRRIHNKHLPRRLYLRHGRYFFVRADGKWENLGTDYGAALKAWAERSAPVGNPATLGQAFDRYRREILPTKSPQTQRGYQQQFKALYKVWRDVLPADVKPTDVYAYLDARGKTSPVQANREKALLSTVFSYLVRWGVVERNPCFGVHRITEHKRDRYVEPWEYKAVYDLATEKMRCAMDLAILTGLRQGDILALTRADFRDDGLLVRTSKTGKKLLFAWTPGLREVWERLQRLQPDVVHFRYLFMGRRGHRLTSSGFQSVWKRLMARALASGGLAERYHFHDIRAVPGSEDSRLLGHADPRMAAVYQRKPVKVTPLK